MASETAAEPGFGAASGPGRPVPEPGGVEAFLRRHFSRITTGDRLIPELDGLRFLAIGTVLVCHTAIYLWLNRLGRAPDLGRGPIEAGMMQGRRGVQLFFAISGFILGLPFLRARAPGGKPVRIGAYFLRRLTRLEPPYVLCMVATFALAVLLRRQMAPPYGLGNLAASLAYAHGLIFRDSPRFNFVTWSLEIEVQFYLLMPLLACVYDLRPTARRALMLAAIVAAAAASTRMHGAGLGPWYTATLLDHIGYFLAGLLVADLFLTDWGQDPGRHWAWDLVFLASWPLLLAGVEDSFAVRLGSAVLVGLILAAGLRGRLVGRLLGNVWPATIGGMCYSIYLWHMPVTNALGRLMPPRPAWMPRPLDLALHGALIVLAVLAFSAALFVLVERPCMRRDWPRRLAARLRHPAPTLAAPTLVAPPAEPAGPVA